LCWAACGDGRIPLSADLLRPEEGSLPLPARRSVSPIPPLRPGLSLCPSCSPAYARFMKKDKENVRGEDSPGVEKAPGETRD